MKQFYNVFSDEKVSIMSTQLTCRNYTTDKEEFRISDYVKNPIRIKKNKNYEIVLEKNYKD